MKSYIVVDKDILSLDSVIAVTNRRKRAVNLIGDLEAEDKYLGLYKPHRYTIIVSKDCENVSEVVRTCL